MIFYLLPTLSIFQLHVMDSRDSRKGLWTTESAYFQLHVMDSYTKALN